MGQTWRTGNDSRAPARERPPPRAGGFVAHGISRLKAPDPTRTAVGARAIANLRRSREPPGRRRPRGGPRGLRQDSRGGAVGVHQPGANRVAVTRCRRQRFGRVLGVAVRGAEAGRSVPRGQCSPDGAVRGHARPRDPGRHGRADAESTRRARPRDRPCSRRLPRDPQRGRPHSAGASPGSPPETAPGRGLQPIPAADRARSTPIFGGSRRA